MAALSVHSNFVVISILIIVAQCFGIWPDLSCYDGISMGVYKSANEECSKKLAGPVDRLKKNKDPGKCEKFCILVDLLFVVLNQTSNKLNLSDGFTLKLKDEFDWTKSPTPKEQMVYTKWRDQVLNCSAIDFPADKPVDCPSWTPAFECIEKAFIC